MPDDNQFDLVEPIMRRVWSMPNKWTFKVPVMRELVAKYAVDGTGWADPFAGQSPFGEFRNDLNPAHSQPSCKEAGEFLKSLDVPLRGVIWDPPYSMEQVSRSYSDIGLRWDQKGTDNLNGGFPRAKDEVARLVIPGGYVVSFGWNTSGMGKGRGFYPVEILVVCHGGRRNDTLCIVERKR